MLLSNKMLHIYSLILMLFIVIYQHHSYRVLVSLVRPMEVHFFFPLNRLVLINFIHLAKNQSYLSEEEK